MIWPVFFIGMFTPAFSLLCYTCNDCNEGLSLAYCKPEEKCGVSNKFPSLNL